MVLEDMIVLTNKTGSVGEEVEESAPAESFSKPAVSEPEVKQEAQPQPAKADEVVADDELPF